MTEEDFTAGLWWQFLAAQDRFEGRLVEAQPELDWDKCWTDSYDASIEFSEVPAEVRLNEAVQKLLSDAGFTTAFVNHKDGWETHYNWPVKFKPVGGWRTKGPALLDANHKRRGIA